MVVSLVDVNLDSNSNFPLVVSLVLNSSCIAPNLNLLKNFLIWVVHLGGGNYKSKK